MMFEYYADNAVYLKTIMGPKGDPSFPDKLKELMWGTVPQKLCIVPDKRRRYAYTDGFLY